MKHNKILFLLFILALTQLASSGDIPSLQKSVERQLGNSDKAVLVVETGNGNVLASSHSEVFLTQKFPPGSLIKLFTLIAYHGEHGMRFPVFSCPATLANDANGCWDRNGHGNVDAAQALAYSCNVYFRQLSARTSPANFAQTLSDFGLIEDTSEITKLSEQTQRKLMVGKTNDWAVEPSRILRAYCAVWNGGYLWRLQNQPSQTVSPLSEGLSTLLQTGLLQASVKGTSIEAAKFSGTSLLGKTGTSLSYSNGVTDRAKTQGWWIGLYPSNRPRIAIMTFVPGGRGAMDAAPLGGTILSLYLKQGKSSHAK